MVLVYGSNVMMGVKVTFRVISPAKRGPQGSRIGSFDYDW